MARHWLDAGRAPPAPGRPERRLRRQAAERRRDQVDPERRCGDEIPVQLGGGIRDLDTIERYLDDGLSYVIIGTAAVKNPGFLHDACTRFPRPHHRRPRRQGRQGRDRRLEQADRPRGGRPGAASSRTTASRRIIYTDIGRDGMLTGINIEATVKLAQALHDPGDRVGRPARTSPTSRSCARCEDEGIDGVICGRAIYAGDARLRRRRRPRPTSSAS